MKLPLSVDPNTKTILAGRARERLKGDNKQSEDDGQGKEDEGVFGIEIQKALTDFGNLSRKTAITSEGRDRERCIKILKKMTAKAACHLARRHMVCRRYDELAGFKVIYCYRVVRELIISALRRLSGHTVTPRKRHNQNVGHHIG